MGFFSDLTSAVGSLFGGGDTAEDMANKANARADFRSSKAQKLLRADSLATQFGGLQEMFAPQISAMLEAQGLAGQASAYGAQAGLGRAGLGNTGLGSAIGAGLTAGSAFMGNQLRARMLQDLLGQAIQTNQMRGQFIAGAPLMMAPQSGDAERAGRLGGTLLGIGGAFAGGGGSGGGSNTPVQ